MAKVFDEISPEFQEFIEEQHMFFIATAPSEGGHINLSPKGLDSFRVLSPTRVGYSDMTGSGNETSAHLAQNGRVTFMFCAFTGRPRILRLYGHGEVFVEGTPEFESRKALYPMRQGIRQIIEADITRVQTSCGYSIPLMDFVEERDTLIKWADRKGDEGLVAYRKEKNLRSIDGLPTHLRDVLGEEEE